MANKIANRTQSRSGRRRTGRGAIREMTDCLIPATRGNIHPSPLGESGAGITTIRHPILNAKGSGVPPDASGPCGLPPGPEGSRPHSAQERTSCSAHACTLGGVCCSIPLPLGEMQKNHRQWQNTRLTDQRPSTNASPVARERKLCLDASQGKAWPG